MDIAVFLAIAGVLATPATWALDKMGISVPKWIYGTVFCASMLMILGAGVATFWPRPAPIMPAPRPPSLIALCRFERLPLIVKPDDTLHLVLMEPLGANPSADWTTYDVPNETAVPVQWPPARVMKAINLSNPFAFVATTVARCELGNHSTANLAAVRVAIESGYGKKPTTRIVVASPLDAGKTFVFYIVNHCAGDDVVTQLPATVAVKQDPTDQWRNAPLGVEYRTPLDRLGLLPKPKIDVLGGGPCAK